MSDLLAFLLYLVLFFNTIMVCASIEAAGRRIASAIRGEEAGDD